MPEITLPDVRFRDLKLPDGLRDMNRRDIQAAINDRIPRRVDLPEVDLTKIELPKAVDERLKQIEKRIDSIDLSKVELPKAIENRLPGRRRRRNPILPIAALVAVASAMAAAWWLITSPNATTRVRQGFDRVWRKMNGQETALVPYDNDNDLGSLLPNPNQTRPSVEAETWPDTFSDLGETVRAGNGSAGTTGASTTATTDSEAASSSQTTTGSATAKTGGSKASGSTASRASTEEPPTV
ncbi:MAG TPA: hypothetical protein VGO64_11020 [Candidatus Limnocylindrales bacterium]|nr:hypothetical protein [Candidatus Limnocylindrales bacterium]